MRLFLRCVVGVIEKVLMQAESDSLDSYACTKLHFPQTNAAGKPGSCTL